MSRTWLPFAVLAVTGCLGFGDGPATTSKGEPLALTARWGPVEVAPGTESTQCAIVELDNEEHVDVVRFETEMGAVAHHFIVYEVPESTPLSAEPYKCRPFADILRGAPLFAAQRARDELRLPSGVGRALEPRQRLRLEMHYINAGETAVSLSGVVRLETASSPLEHEADFLFLGDIDIELAPQLAGTVGPTFIPMPAPMSGASYFAFAGHTHALGTDVVVTASASPDATDSEQVYAVEGYNWDEPEMVTHNPVIRIPDGGGFNIACEFVNTTDRTVRFGEAAEDEMCFVVAYYYPSSGPRVCGQSDGIGVGCCPEVPFVCDLLGAI